MKKLDSKQLKSLNWGDKVYRFDRWDFRKLYFVGKMPRSENYLIFCDGDYLTYLYINKDDSFSYDWYSGEYDSKFVGELKLKELKSRIESVKSIYKINE